LVTMTWSAAARLSSIAFLPSSYSPVGYSLSSTKFCLSRYPSCKTFSCKTRCHPWRTVFKCQLENKQMVSVRRFTVFSVWVSFLIYAFGFAPGSFDVELLKQLISNPLDSNVNSIFLVIFNGLGILPALYCAFLLPREKSESLQAWPFLLLSFFLGFFALGPYLALRKARTTNDKLVEYSSAPLTESKWFRYSLLVFVLALCSVGLKIFPLLEMGVKEQHYSMPWDISLLVEWDKYLQLFHNYRFVHVSSIDFVILCFFLAEPLYEDMRLRGFFQKDSRLLDGFLWLATWFVPLIGPSIYLCTRPPWNNKEKL
jgi:hypothetical protein